MYVLVSIFNRCVLHWQVSSCGRLCVWGPSYVWQQSYPNSRRDWPADWSPLEPPGGSPLYWKQHRTAGQKKRETLSFCKRFTNSLLTRKYSLDICECRWINSMIQLDSKQPSLKYLSSSGDISGEAPPTKCGICPLVSWGNCIHMLLYPQSLPPIVSQWISSRQIESHLTF